MKLGWEVKALGEVANITKRQGGSRPLPYVGLEDVSSGGTGRFLGSMAPQLDKSTTFEFEPNHVLYGRLRPYLNKVLLPDFVGHCSSEIFPILPSARLDRRFLFYWITNQTTVDAINETCTGARMPRANVADIFNFPIPLPPLDEQKRIVAVLDAAFDGLSRARAHTESNLQNARELFESISRAAFEGDGAAVTLGEVADIPSALVDPREAAYADLPHVGAGNMETGSDQLVNVMTAREEKLISGKFTFDTSMVLYSKIRPYLRKAARPEFGGLCSADVYPLRPNPLRLDRNYLFHLLMGPDFTEYAISGSGRVGMPKVNRNHLFAYTFTIPILAAQREVTAKIDAAMEYCEQVAAHYRAKLADLDALRQALLQKAFAGELT